MVSKKRLSTKERRRALTEWDFFTEEILPRLPANQLQKLKTVCKYWYRMLSTPDFIGFHLKTYNQSRIRILMPHNYGRILREYKINSDGETELQIPYPPAMRIRQSKILGSCDGLLCLLLLRTTGDHTIAVYNPSTGMYLLVQSSLKYDYINNCSWFGQHPCSGEYVLVLGNNCSEFSVYKFNNGRRNSKLKMIQSTSESGRFQPLDVYVCYQDRVGTLLHGALHWPLYRPRNAISAYRLDDNKHFKIAPPVHRDSSLYDFKLGVAEGCLFSVFRDADYATGVFELWIMKEYRVEQSWTKYANIQGFENRVVAPLAFLPNGDDLILHPNKSEFIKCTFDHDKALLLMNCVCGCEAITCADSLMSPKIVIA